MRYWRGRSERMSVEAMTIFDCSIDNLKALWRGLEHVHLAVGADVVHASGSARVGSEHQSVAQFQGEAICHGGSRIEARLHHERATV